MNGLWSECSSGVVFKSDNPLFCSYYTNGASDIQLQLAQGEMVIRINGTNTVKIQPLSIHGMLANNRFEFETELMVNQFITWLSDID